MIKHKITDKEKTMVNGGITMEENKEPVVPVPEKFLLTIKEAAAYFSIGEKKMRRMAEDNLGTYAVFSGNRYLVIRPKFEEYICQSSTL